jgi:hypothetical protein
MERPDFNYDGDPMDRAETEAWLTEVKNNILHHRSETDSLHLLETLEIALMALPDKRLVSGGLARKRYNIDATLPAIRHYEFCPIGAVVAMQVINKTSPIAPYNNYHEHFVPWTIKDIACMDISETAEALMPWGLSAKIAYGIWNTNDIIGCGELVYETEDSCWIHNGENGRPDTCPTEICANPSHSSALNLTCADDEDEETLPLICALRHGEECPTQYYAGFRHQPSPEERFELMLAWTHEQITLGRVERNAKNTPA